MKDIMSRRTKLDKLFTQLINERSSFETHWQDLSDFVSPRRLVLSTEDVNEGEKRNENIIDSTASYSARILSSGMMAGITSPSRPWFRLATNDQDLNKIEAVKVYLDSIQRKMSDIFIKSNLYNVLPIGYKDVGTFGTGCIFMEEDFDEVVRFHSFPLGSFFLAVDDKGRVNTFAREYDMTVGQIIGKFARKSDGSIDFDNVTESTKNLYESGDTEAWVTVRHVIQQNSNYDPEKLESRYKKFESVYYEQGKTSGSSQGLDGNFPKKFLRESGYNFFPVLAPRWEVTGGDVYGTDCPGMTALGDIKQLQKGEEKVLLAIDKMIDPPMKGPSTLKNASILPGDITYEDDIASTNGGFRPVHEVNFRVDAMEGKQGQVRERIRKAYFEDLFLMLASSDRRQITATEVDARKEEKLLALGPVLEQLNQDLLDPLIDNTFIIMEELDLLPEPPEELEGVDLKIEYVSIMAQAQKLVGLAGLDRFMNHIGLTAQYNEQVLDKIDFDKETDIYADVLGITPGIVRGEERVAELRNARAEQQAQAAQAEQLQAAASTAKSLSETDTSGDNALTAIAGGLA